MVGTANQEFDALRGGLKKNQIWFQPPNGTAPGSTSGANSGKFAMGVTGVIGIQLGDGNYGWIRLLIEDLGPNQPYKHYDDTLLQPGPYLSGKGYADKVTVIDWAYDDSGGQIHVPVPAPLALLAAGAAGLAAFRRRKSQRGQGV